MMRRLVLLVCLLSPACGCLAPWREGDSNEDTLKLSSLPERFAIPRDGDAVVLPVTVQDKTYLFLLDSGASCNSFDTSLLSGEPISERTVRGADGDTRLKLFKSPDAHLGVLSVRSRQPVVGMDFTKLREATGHDIYGVLGMPFLRKHVVELNFDDGEACVRNDVAPNCGEPFDVGFEFLSGVPTISVGVGDSGRHKFLFDLGCASTADLNRHMFESERKKNELQLCGSALSESITGTTEHKTGKLTQLSLGDLAVHDCLVDDAVDSKLGLGFCSRFIITLDFPHDHVYLKKGARFGTPDRPDRSGIHLVKRDGKLVVHSVQKGSAGQSAGVNEGDVLLKLDESGAQSLTLFQVRRKLREASGTVKATISRLGQEREVVLRLPEARG
jgi:hypothetical protein